MTYQGKVKDGQIVLEPEAELPDGALVTVEVEIPGKAARAEKNPLLRMTDLAVETGIEDLATNINHYLYGHPKVEDER
jgi:hypothetical protein